jgi:hypothetical protein
MPRAIPAPVEILRSGGPGKVLVQIATAPAVLALGLMATGVSKLLGRNTSQNDEPVPTPPAEVLS